MNKRYTLRLIKQSNKLIQFETLESFLSRGGQIQRSVSRNIIYLKGSANFSRRRSAA